jgi:IS4 transposase
MFPDDVIRQLAEETGQTKRQRLVDAVLFFWLLILDFGVNYMRELRGLHRGYMRRAQVTMAFSSFLERFTPELEEFLHRCALHAIEFQAKTVHRQLGEKLKGFSDILIQDCTILRLHESLSKLWPAARSSTAAAGVKLAYLTGVVADSPERLRIVPERTADVNTLKLGPWVKDKVLLLDLGFFKLGFFDRIHRYKGFFVTRLKRGVNAVIVAENMTWRGNAKELVGRNVWDVVRSLKRGVLDVDVRFVIKRRRYKDKCRKVTRRFRLVGVYNPDAKRYHLYLTNIPASVLSAADVALLYGARWDIELVFKELKSVYHMDQIKTKDPCTIRCLIWVAIITLLCSRRVLHMFRSTDPENAHLYSHLRSAKVFMEHAHDILLGVLAILGIPFGPDEMMKIHRFQLVDPNAKRKRLMDPVVT